jgi:hypothetical protein
MTYQPYPTGGGSNIVQQQRGRRPQTVLTAVILMYVGAGLSAISLIATIAFSGRIKNAVGKALRNAKTSKPLTASQIHSIESIYLVIAIVVLLVGVGLWLWMAWANGRGRGWARVLATVFFGLDTLFVLASLLRTGHTGSTLALTALEWVVGLVAIIFLWLRDTSDYIAQSKSR